ncbi:hypothetical protein D1814_15855 [Alteromonas sp. BL110]|uniref:hypothetical protein n=1 Tax=Alteromonas sp. BL110 TaxID=1714845 RepID=UPI000E549E0B|nr:hypothetical protein [Alteromonas sp. BL110]AXT40052.1 hypothetical protein D1814_15855 [Alteromonas sp. BL110]RKM79281.1 hypothetical protein D7031_09850 [Alteromonas sp. BL110]
MTIQYFLKAYHLFLRAFLCCFTALACSVSAHSLPGSELVFKNIGPKASLSLSFPLEELIIAAPELDFIEHASSLADLTNREKSQLNQYFRHHIQLKPSNAKSQYAFLSPSLHSLVLTEAFNEHVGNYKRVEAQFSLGIETLQHDFFPLALRYDAIMHEIRSHRVAVFFESAKNRKTKLTDFIYREVNGEPTVHVLSPAS